MAEHQEEKEEVKEITPEYRQTIVYVTKRLAERMFRIIRTLVGPALKGQSDTEIDRFVINVMQEVFVDMDSLVDASKTN